METNLTAPTKLWGGRRRGAVGWNAVAAVELSAHQLRIKCVFRNSVVLLLFHNTRDRVTAAFRMSKVKVGWKKNVVILSKAVWVFFTNAHMAADEHARQSQPRAAVAALITVLLETVGAVIHCCLRAGSGLGNHSTDYVAYLHVFTVITTVIIYSVMDQKVCTLLLFIDQHWFGIYLLTWLDVYRNPAPPSPWGLSLYLLLA